jgi:dolichyl-phosphate beta-glucosyltransferase
MTIREVGVYWRNSPESKVHPFWHSLEMLRDLFRIRGNACLGRYSVEPPK